MTAPSTTMTISLIVNGCLTKVAVHPLERLIDVLRDKLGLTGTKEGCGEGECGACTIIMNGKTVLACLVPAISAEGAEIRTIEGLQKTDGGLHPMQKAFFNEGGAQCGFCTPGMVMSAVNYAEHPEIAEDEREALAGNQCRCTGYTRIFSSFEKGRRK